MTYDEIEDQIKQLWPDKCPECGSPAYIGMNAVQCVSKSCRNGNEKEFERYAKLIGKQLDIAINEVPAGSLFVKDTGGWANPTKLDIEDDEPTQPGAKPFKWGTLS